MLTAIPVVLTVDMAYCYGHRPTLAFDERGTGRVNYDDQICNYSSLAVLCFQI